MGKQHSRGSIFSWLAAASLILACHMACKWLAGCLAVCLWQVSETIVFWKFFYVLCSSLSSSFIMHLLIWVCSLVYLMFWGLLSQLNQSNDHDQTTSQPLTATYTWHDARIRLAAATQLKIEPILNNSNIPLYDIM